jgi:glutaredoxin-related protein
MTRPLLDAAQIHPAIRDRVGALHRDVVDEVRAAVERERVVVVGMGQNPFPRRARKALDAKGVPYRYLEYGNYLSQWRRRNALKMWTGWPTLPIVFVNGQLVGGAQDLEALISSGELDRLLAQPYPAR